MEVSYNDNQVQALTTMFKDFALSDQLKIFNTAYRKGTKQMVNYAKSIVPRRTGNLAKSIGTIFLRQDVAVLIGAKKAYKGWHGHLIENGTVQRFRKTKGGAPTGRVIGVHFMEQAYNNNIDYVINAIHEEWLAAIDKYIQKFNSSK